MGKRVLAILDPDSEFAFRFMELAKRMAFVSMDVKAFTSVELLRRSVEKGPPELLLISSSVWSEELRAIPAGKIVLLLEDREMPASDIPGVYKYQAPGALLRKALGFCEEKESEEVFNRSPESLEIIGIYSPVGRTRKTSFALTLGQILAKNRAVLYLNLETFAGFEAFLSEQYDRTLSDLLYFGRQKEIDLQSRLRGITRNLKDLEYVPPVLSPEDLQMVTGEEWLELFGRIREQTSYEVMILDLGDAVQGLTSILAACDRIVLPIRSDPLSQAKTEQFLWFLCEKQGKDVEERICKVKIPFGQNGKTGKEYLFALPESELGEMIQKDLMEGGILCRKNG